MSYIVELGPGTGCFTQELYANVSRDCKVLIIELNTAYIQFLRDKYGDRFEIIQGSAADLDALIEERDWPRVDLIVSGLPFTLPSEVMAGCDEVAAKTHRVRDYLPLVHILPLDHGAVLCTFHHSSGSISIPEFSTYVDIHC